MRRRRIRRRRRAGSYPLQLAGAATFIALATYMVVLVVEKAAHPYWLGHSVQQEVTQMREQLAEQNARNARLRAQVQYLESEEGAETAARRAGYRRPGEQVYLLPPTPAQESTAGGQ